VKKSFIAFLLTISCIVHAQDSCNIQISLLTCTPGNELYSTFGHSAFRVKEMATGTDIIFNYGTFDFYDPEFYKKFTLGKLLYFVSVDSLAGFLAEYEYFGRGVTEQVLNIGCNEKKELVAALHENAKEENKYYLYDFTYDNCTTRLRVMLEKTLGRPLQTKNILPSSRTTFRHLIHEYLHKGNQYWSKLGIDILLGSPLDRRITNREAQFLPDYLLKGFDSSTTETGPLVIKKNTLLPTGNIYGPAPFFTPLIVFSILFVLTLVLTFLKPGSTFLKAFDVFFFLVCGLLGFLILFMWFGTSHVMCRENYNLLWALPTHLFMALMLFTRKNWVNAYFRFIFFYCIVLVIVWFMLPQQFNTALLPVIGIMMTRSFSISKRNMYGKRNNHQG
jgi:hypothetical protein